MYLDSNALSVSFPLEEAVKLIDSLVKAKYWVDFKKGDLKLVYMPCWFFNYAAHKDSEKDKEKKTKIISSGRLSFLEFSHEFDESIVKLYSSFEKNVSNEASGQYPSDVQDSRLSKDELDSVIRVKLASDLDVSKDNITISALEKIYLPVWSVSVTLGEENYKTVISAVDGEIISEEEIPEKERGWLEITAETINDLKKPDAWLGYATGIGSKFVPKGISKAASPKPIWQDKGLLVLLGAIIVFALLVLSAFGII